jgi:hypothetical protein
MTDGATDRFQARQWRPSKLAVILIALQLIAPLFGPWYLFLPFLALFAGLSYWDLKKIRRSKAQDTRPST